MNKTALSRGVKRDSSGRTSGVRELLFSYNSSKNAWYYRTKSGLWRNIRDINAYGLVYLLEQLEKRGRETGRIWQVIKEEVDARRKCGELK